MMRVNANLRFLVKKIFTMKQQALTNRSLKNQAICALLCLIPLSNSLPTFAQDRSNVAEESKARLQRDIEFIASDAMEGRGTQTTGLVRAGEFIAQRWKELGLKVDSFDGQPFQNFSIPGPLRITEPSNNTLSWIGDDGKSISFELGKDFTPVSLGSNGSFEGDLVFVGYGISAKSEMQYDDYEGIDVQGKIVVMVRKEPQQQDPKSRFAGTDPSDFSFYSAKLANAVAKGAAAIIVVNDRITAQTTIPWSTDARQEFAKVVEELRKVQLDFEQTPSDAAAQKAMLGRLQTLQDKLQWAMKGLQVDGDQLPLPDGVGRSFGRKKIPAIFIKREKADSLIKTVMGKSLEEIEVAIDNDLTPRSQVLAGWKAVGKVEIKEARIPVRNVIAVLPGKGDLASEYVVVGAHYDHVGMGGVGSLAPGTMAVHNGADDNGSGTVCLLEASRQLKERLAQTPKHRTLVFMAFTAEELGLLGSAHYVRNPRFPLEQTVAMVNMDMVGRLADNVLTVYGTGTAKDFDQLIESTNERYHFELDKSPEGMGPSDHQSFFEKKIPVFHFFTGLHGEYHRPSDDFDKINVTGMVRITDMVTDVVSQLVTRETRPEFVAIRGSANPRQQSNNRAKLQVTIANGEGVVIESVQPGGAADNAGILAGDRVIQLGDKAISSMDSLRETLEARKPGEKMSIQIERNGEKKTLEIRLGR